MVYDRNGNPISTGSAILNVRTDNVFVITRISYEFGSIWLHYTVTETSSFGDVGFRGLMEFEHRRVVPWLEVIR